MNDTTLVGLALASMLVAALVFAGAVWAAQRAGRALRYAIARERDTGHRRLRQRVTNLVGRKQDTMETVLKADTMPGYVWFHWSRRPREPFVEIHGWAPFEWAARVQLRRNRPPSGRSARR